MLIRRCKFEGAQKVSQRPAKHRLRFAEASRIFWSARRAANFGKGTSVATIAKHPPNAYSAMIRHGKVSSAPLPMPSQWARICATMVRFSTISAIFFD